MVKTPKIKGTISFEIDISDGVGISDAYQKIEAALENLRCYGAASVKAEIEGGEIKI